MKSTINTYWLVILLVWTSLLNVNAQTSLTLTYGNPSTSADSAFNGTVFQAGAEVGDAYFFAKFGGSGTRYFEVDSPGENTTKKISSDGYVSIRPLSSMVIDQSKIKSFTGVVSGSIVVSVKPLSITNVIANVVTEITPGSEITISYFTGAGTFPAGLAKQGFTAQLLTSSGGVINLLNPVNQYSGKEQAGFSGGGIRTIKATIPQSTTSGSYRVQVIPQGLIVNTPSNPSSSFTVKANGSTSAAIMAATVSGSYCAGSIVALPFSTTGTFPTGNTFKAQLINADGSVLQDSLGSSLSSPINLTLPTSFTTGTYRFRITAATTNAQSNTSSLSVLALPTMAISGNSTITAGTTAPVQLAFTGAPPWSFTYTDNTTLRSVTSATSSTTISPTFLSTTTVDKSFIKSFRDANCVSNQITGSAQITVNQLTITTGSVSGSYCPGSTVPVSFSVSSTLPSSVTYQVQLSDQSGGFSNAQVIGSGQTSPIVALLPTTLLTGTGYRIQVIIPKPASTSLVDYSTSSSLITISRPNPPVIANVSVCSGSGNTTGPLSATGTGIKWYTSVSSLSLTSAPTPSENQPGTYTYYVSQTINECESLRQPVSVTVNATPSAPSVSSVTLCQGSQGQFSTSIPNPKWYTSSTAVTGSSQPPTINSQTNGDQIVYVTQTLNGCESPRTPVKATVYAIPSPPTVVSSLSVCQYTNANSLTATGSGLIWYNQLGKLSSAPAPNTSLPGTQSYSVTQTLNTCESSQAIINVVILEAPTALTVTNAQVCVGESPRSLTVTSSNPKWYTSPISGTASPTSPAFSTDVAKVFTFYVSQTGANGCESLRQPISVSVVAASAAPSVSSVSLCQGAQGQFTSSIPNALWYANSTGGTGSTQPPTLNNQAVGDQTVYVTQNTTGCESPRTPVKATVYSIPPVPTIPAQSLTAICQYSTASSLTAVGSSLTWYNSSGKLAGAPTPSTSLSGIQSFSVTQTVNTCESARTVVNIYVRSAPPVPTANSVRYCINDVPRSITVSSGLNPKWYTTATGGTSTPTSPPFLTEIAMVSTFYVTQTDSNGCESLRQPVSVSVVTPPSAPSVTSSQLICQSTKAGSLTASPNTGLIWQGSGFTGTSDIAPVPVTSQPGTFTYSVVQKVGTCVSPAAQITITVSPTPSSPSVQTPVVVCVGTASTALSATGSNITWYTNADHSGSSLTKVIPNTNQAGVTAYYVTQRDANNCESPNSIVEVRVSPKATALITGDNDIYPSDSTAIRVRLTGDAPWTFNASWNPNPIKINNSKDSLYVAWVKPTSTTTYLINNLTSACGAGVVVAPYTLRVLQPLGVQPILEPITVLVYPNPLTDALSVDWRSPTKQTVTLQIIDAKGAILQQFTRSSTTTSQVEVFQMSNQPAGLYFLQVRTPTNGVITKSILKQ